MINKKNSFIASAIAGLFLTGISLACAESAPSGEAAKVPTKTVGECHGINACKGQGECGGAGTSCHGTNACKGKGWITTDKDECAKKGGTFKEG